MNIAIAGLGTVGAGVVRLLRQNADLIAARAGQPITVKAFSARDKGKKRDCDLSGAEWVDDPLKLAQRPDVAAIVELIGGAEGKAYELARAALGNAKHFVTANKALVAAHGAELARLAEKNHLQLLFEASVGGGIPVIKTLREGLAANRISSVRGILNGTCNYILTRMREANLGFDAALHEAQQHGYAEADPSSDIDGHDTANKLSILAALAFGMEPDLKVVQTEGIRHVTPLDLQFAGELECRVKLLGVARLGHNGLEQRVAPVLVPVASPLAKVNGALNAVSITGDFCGEVMLQGQGAGAEPTASAVVADVIDIAKGSGAGGQGSGTLFAQTKSSSIHDPRPPTPDPRFYIRLQVTDKPGVVADVSAILRDEAISIESLIQRGKSATQSVPVVITTHAAKADAMKRAAEKITRIGAVVEKPCVMRIED